MSRILVSGASGQLGRFVAETASAEVALVLADRKKFDVSNKDSVESVMAEIKPEYVVNCAAFTNVDGAEENQLDAFAVNHLGLENLIDVCKRYGTKLIHISTDFVFDGLASEPYLPSAKCNPLGVYGQSKWQGEVAIHDHYPEGSMIIRTSWLYSEFGNNFVKTMLKLHENKDRFQVVCDQFGSPTYARGLAELIWSAIASKEFSSGIFHWCDAGVTNWFEFAAEIGEQGRRCGVIPRIAKVDPISAVDYGALAPRPGYSVLNCEETLRRFPMLRQDDWTSRLSEMLKNLAALSR